MTTPPDVSFLREQRLLVWRPRGVLDEKTVNGIIAFIGAEEATSQTPFHRFSDVTAIEAVDLNFKYIFHVALYRRLSYAGRPPVKSAFLVKEEQTAHYTRLHAMITDRSPLQVKIFEDLAAAAAWLNVPTACLTIPTP